MTDWRTRAEKTQDRILATYPHLVEEIFQERGDATGKASWWVYLKPGLVCTATETHSLHEDSIREIEALLRRSITECDCGRCK